MYVYAHMIDSNYTYKHMSLYICVNKQLYLFILVRVIDYNYLKVAWAVS